MRTSAQFDKIIPALLKAQSEMSPVLKEAKNPHFKSKFADLSSVLGMIKPKLNANGILLTQATAWISEGTLLITRLTHESGQWVESSFMISPIKDDPQAFGSALTYGKRYSLEALLSIETTDDDAEKAMGRQEQPSNVPNKAPTVAKSATPQTTMLPMAAEITNPPSKWVAAVQAQGQPNHDPIGDYTPTFGKYKGMKIREVLVHDLNNYCEYLQKSASTSERPLGANAVLFIEKVKEFLKTREPVPKKPEPTIEEIERAFSMDDIPF